MSQRVEHRIDFQEKSLDNGYVVRGWLNYDTDCENPLESCDGMGTIRSFISKHISYIDQDEAQRICQENQHAVLLSYFEHGSCIWRPAGALENMADFRWDGTRNAGIWYPDPCLIPEIERRAKAYSEGRIVETEGHKGWVATWKDQRQTFTEWGAAFTWLSAKVTVEKPSVAGLQAARLELAAAACREYTAWCNGECYGYTVQADDDDGARRGETDCYGFVGYEYAQERLHEVFQHYVNKFGTLPRQQPGEH